MFPSGFFVIHDATACGQNNVTAMRTREREGIRFQFSGRCNGRLDDATNIVFGMLDLPKLTGRQQIVGPLLNIVDWHVEAWWDDTALVKTTGQIDNDFAGTVIVDNFEFADVAVLHHHSQELDDNLRAWAQQNLTFATFLSIVDALQGIG